MDTRVEVGGFALAPGSPAGTLIERSDGSAGGGESEALRQALDAPAPAKAETGPALATEVEEASEETAKIERAVALGKGIAEGQALDPTQLGLEVGALLDFLERLDRKGKHKKSLQMARALTSLLMLLKRWADLLKTLRGALRAAEQLGDQEAIAWARHELGTLRLAAGDIEGADRELRQAREIREQIGDRRGLAATERNMRVLCDRMRQMLREKELVRPRPGSGQTASLRLALLAAAFLALFGGGIAAGMALGGGSGGGENVAATATDNPDTGQPGGDTSGDTDGDGDVTPVTDEELDEGPYPLEITVAGEGSGAVEIEGFECGEVPCLVPAGESLTLVAYEKRGSEFGGFSGSCISEERTCEMTAKASMAVTATFDPFTPSEDTSTVETEDEEETEASKASGSEEATEETETPPAEPSE